MKYKVGDKVKVKSLDWYNHNKGFDGAIDFDAIKFISPMRKFLGVKTVISGVGKGCYSIGIDDDGWLWTDEMFEEDYGSTLSKEGGIMLVDNGATHNPCTDYTDTLKVSIELIKSGMNPNDVANMAKSIIVKLKQD